VKLDKKVNGSLETKMWIIINEDIKSMYENLLNQQQLILGCFFFRKILYAIANGKRYSKIQMGMMVAFNISSDQREFSPHNL
jgi:hypothetical protein